MPAADTRRTGTALVALLLVTGLALTGCRVATTPTAAPPQSDTYTGGITTLVVDVDDLGASQIGSTDAAVDVRVTGADRSDVQVDRTAFHTEGDRPVERIAQAGTTLTVAVTCPQTFAVGTPTCRAGYEVQVPYGTAVRAGTRNGDLTVDDPRAAVELRSHGGDVTVTVARDGGSYAVVARAEEGTRTVDVPEDPAGTPVRAVSDEGDVTVTRR